jgi:hypothetical protein
MQCRTVGARLAKYCAGVMFVVLGLAFRPEFAVAQSNSSSFCPAGFTFVNGFCAFQGLPETPPSCPKGFGPISFGCAGLSTAALSSQTLSQSSQSLTQQAMASTLEAVQRRREQESRRCPAGYEYVNARCQKVSEGQAIGYAQEPVYKSPVLKTVAIESGPSTSRGIWVQAFGNYENRSGTATTSFLQRTQTVDLGSTVRSWGVVGGADLTMRNVAAVNDAVMFGVLGGYMTSDVSFSGSQTTATMEGPSVGVYATYVRGGFSTDLTFKVDFLNLSQTFADFTGDSLAVTGSNSVGLKNYSIADNLNYKIMLAGASFVEPTAGINYTRSVFGDGAAALGLQDGSITRLQGGARVGTVYMLDRVTVEPSLTMLAYSNVQIDGGVAVQNGFGGPSVAPNDEGKVRGDLIGWSNVDFRNGFFGFAGGEYRFGQDLRAWAGRLGVRYVW